MLRNVVFAAFLLVANLATQAAAYDSAPDEKTDHTYSISVGRSPFAPVPSPNVPAIERPDAVVVHSVAPLLAAELILITLVQAEADHHPSPSPPDVTTTRLTRILIETTISPNAP